MRRGIPLFALPIALSACTYHVWSPPARVMPLEGVEALEEREVRAQVNGNYHASVEVFDDRPSAAGAALAVAVGLGDDVDINLTGQALHLPGGGTSDLDRTIWAGRVGARWSAERWAALSLGAGAGANAAGPFVVPDVGVTLGDGNEYIGFFVDLRFGVSIPVDPKTLDLTLPGDRESHLATPRPTLVAQLTPGMRFTLLRPNETSTTEVVLRLAPSVSFLTDDQRYAFWLGGGLGLEVSFGAPQPAAAQMTAN